MSGLFDEISDGEGGRSSGEVSRAKDVEKDGEESGISIEETSG